MQQLMKVIPEKQLKERKILIHKTLLTKLHSQLTDGGDGCILN